MKTAIILVDPQNTFSERCLDELPVKDALDIVSPINQIFDDFDYKILTLDSHPETACHIATEEHPQFTKIENCKESDIYWNKHGQLNSYGYQPLDGLPSIESGKYDFIVWKGMHNTFHPYGACYHDLSEKLSTGLLEFLLFNNVNRVYVCGLALDFCVWTTAKQIFKKFYELEKPIEIIIPKECTKPIISLDKPYYDFREEMLERGVDIKEYIIYR